MDRQQEIRIAERARHDPRAFQPLYEAYFEKILGFVYRRVLDQQAAEDLTADTFEKAIRGLDRFRDHGLGVSAWLYRIAHNCVVDYYRWQAKAQIVPLDLAENIPGDAPDPQEHALAQEAQAVRSQQESDLVRAVGSLSEEAQLIISLKYFEQKAHREIAEIVGCSENNLGVKVHRILEKLRQRLEEVSHVNY